MSNGKKRVTIVLLLVALLILIVISFNLGKYPISVKELIGIIASKFMPVTQFWTSQMETIFFNVRLPRVIMACLVGCCLAAAGASYQGIFNNPMASPEFMGASDGAAFGAALAIIIRVSGPMITVSAFIFSLLGVGLAYFISRKVRGNKITGLVLAGVTINALAKAGTSYMKLIADPNDQMQAITFWLMGSLSGVKRSDVLFAIIPILIGLIPLVLIRWKINILTMGDDEAKSMGINPRRTRMIIIFCATLITAAAVSVCGVIGWVGLVIPHLSRRIVGNNYKYLLPASMVMGAIFLLIVDNVARTVWTTDIPLGILTAVVGAPFFIYLLTRKEGSN